MTDPDIEAGEVTKTTTIETVETDPTPTIRRTPENTEDDTDDTEDDGSDDGGRRDGDA